MSPTNCILLLALAVIAALPLSSVSRTLRVDQDGGEFSAIQHALDAAASGDTVLVGPGTYTGNPNRNLDPNGRSIVLRSSGGADVTIIDCEDQGRGMEFEGAHDLSCTVEGFSIVNGAEDYGAGIHASDGAILTVSDCVVTSCSSNEGGGIYARGCSLTLKNVTFSENHGSWRGGGLYVRESSAKIVHCDFKGGSGGEGGGIHCRDCTIAISGCTFTRNNAGSGGGGGIDCDECDDATIESCTFIDNDSYLGGGIRCVESRAIIIDCTFEGNSSGFNEWGRGGGGVRCDWCSPTISDCLFRDNSGAMGGALRCEENSHPLVERCVFARNSAILNGGAFYCGEGCEPTIEYCTFRLNSAGQRGGGMFCNSSDPRIQNCTFHDNQVEATLWGNGGGIYCANASPIIRNTIIANSGKGDGIHCQWFSFPNISRCCIYGNEGGDELCGSYLDNMVEDPMFCDTSNGVLTVRGDSPCLPMNNRWGELVGARDQGCGWAGQFIIDGVVRHDDDGARMVFTAMGIATVSIRIYDLYGRLIATVADDETLSSGTSKFWTWDLRSDGGRAVASGTYLCIATVGPENISRRIAVIR